MFGPGCCVVLCVIFSPAAISLGSNLAFIGVALFV